MFRQSANIRCGQVAQSVEQWTENPRVGSSILPLATIVFQNCLKRKISVFRAGVLVPVKSLFTVKYVRCLVVCILVFWLVSCGQSPKTVSVDDAWIRTPLPSKTTSAGYVSLQNQTKVAITLTSADSETIGAIEFHKSEIEDGKHRMRKLEALEIPAKDTLKLEPGSFHLMLFRIQDVEEDKHVINFYTESDLTFQATFEIRDEAPD